LSIGNEVMKFGFGPGMSKKHPNQRQNDLVSGTGMSSLVQYELRIYRSAAEFWRIQPQKTRRGVGNKGER
jgi:hypothetical protein